MKDQRDQGSSRRWFLLNGVAAAAVGALAGAREALARVLPTEVNILGPYHRKGAPFRTKLSAANEPGEVLVVRGRVLNTDERPLKGALLDVWQANAAGRYDNDDPANPPDPEKFLLRGQMRTDAEGRYEFETVLPGRYTIGPGQFRPRHIHFIISCPGYVPLTTQLYFNGDPHLKTDQFVRKSLIIDLAEQKPAGERRKGHLSGVFNIVLARPGETGKAAVTPAVHGTGHDEELV